MSTPVYRGYTQQQLDAQYDQRTLVPDLKFYLDKWRGGADAVSQRTAPQTGIAYGAAPGEFLDVFRGPNCARRLHLHFHGGAWRLLDSRDSWFIAPQWLEAGYAFAAVNFGAVPDVSLAEQVAQARRALEWCARNAETLGIDPARITVGGHSSGAHLAAMAALADWGRPQPAVQAVILASGAYDLEPVQKSARNAYLKLSEADAEALSPARRPRQDAAPPCAIMWSTNELDEFQRQGAAYTQVLARCATVECHRVDTANHFDTWDLVAPGLIAHLID